MGVVGMMNYIWIAMLLLGIAFAGVTGQMAAFSDQILSNAREAVEFVIGLAGIMGVWSGIMNIARKTGLIDAAARLAAPVMRFLFPGLTDKETVSAILMSFMANVFGAGNSATVFSLQAMTLLDRQNGGRETASNAMCMFLAVNMSMVQLVPITVLAIRSETGSANPESIIIPSILAGLFSMAVSIALCKYYERRDRKKWRRS